MFSCYQRIRKKPQNKFIRRGKGIKIPTFFPTIQKNTITQNSTRWDETLCDTGIRRDKITRMGTP